tara:strand:+ start:496 stop:903 length:408 start_codon:yes stop_codon:yes gene_type:complete
MPNSGRNSTGPTLHEIAEQDITLWPTPKSSISGDDLATAAARWPTPTARDHKDGSYCPNVPVNGLLGRAVWPTTTTSDASGGGNRNSAGSNAHAGMSLTDACLTGDSSTPRSVVSGSLNPTWVEWLMGFPIGWTV